MRTRGLKPRGIERIEAGKVYTLEINIKDRIRPEMYAELRVSEISSNYRVLGVVMDEERCHINFERRRRNA